MENAALASQKRRETYPHPGCRLNMRSLTRKLLATWIAGLLALLPLLLTVSLLAWAANLVHRYVGPGSLIGRLIALLGQPFLDQPVLDYLFGALVVILLIFPLGGLVRSTLTQPLVEMVGKLIARIPLVGSLYSLAERFTGLLEQKKDADIGAMSPVWCIFGGDGVAVLALRPIPDSILIEGREYAAVLVPTAPVPIGGGLLYVPVEWVRPANIGVDKLSSIYFSMGIVPPPGTLKASQSGPLEIRPEVIIPGP
ncbi:MAG: hypothetical protein H6Q00_2620 [Holophagaceae bacterium]|nr:hypothetical protein [Holophagaceae bacterium]